MYVVTCFTVEKHDVVPKKPFSREILHSNAILTSDFVLTHFLLPTCCSEPPAMKLNWCPSHDEYKPSPTPSAAAPIGCTHFPLLVCFRLPFSKTNSNLLNKEVNLTHFCIGGRNLFLTQKIVFRQSITINAGSCEFTIGGLDRKKYFSFGPDLTQSIIFLLWHQLYRFCWHVQSWDCFKRSLHSFAVIFVIHISFQIGPL